MTNNSSKPLSETFNDLAKLYLIRDLLISKLADGIEITLTESERRVDELIDNPYLLKLVRMLDKFFWIKEKDSVRIIRSYRHRLNLFVHRTIGLEEYGALLPLNKEELENELKYVRDELLRNKDMFLVLEGQVDILLKWFGRKGGRSE